MFLVDTNVWLERLLDRAQAAEVGEFLARIPSDELLITDFTLHSIGIILARFGRRDALLQFVRDVLIDGSVVLATVEPAAMLRLVEAMGRFGLDFDDAYQYLAAEQHDAVIVSFDADFDQTERGRLTPAAALNAA